MVYSLIRRSLRHLGTSSQLQVAMSNMSSASVAGVDLPVVDKMKILGVVLDRRLSFDIHATTVARACNYHIQAIRHIRHLLTTELAHWRHWPAV